MESTQERIKRKNHFRKPKSLISIIQFWIILFGQKKETWIIWVQWFNIYAHNLDINLS